MNILIGVDESPFSQAALEYVKRFPWPQGTRVRVISASPPVFVGPGEAAAPGVIAQLMQDQDRMHTAIAERAGKDLQGTGLQVESAMVAGDPRSTIVEEARRMNADLIVVGSHGRSGISKLLLGSVAAHVASHAATSVLIVKRSH